MAQNKIDLNRGVEKRFHPEGVEVYMYSDEPGVYFNAYGTEVSEELAKGAGYNVDNLRKHKLRKERMATAMKAIQDELNIQDVVEETVKERRDFKVVHIGLERHNVVDPDGNVLNTTPLTKAMAEALFDKLVPEVEPRKPAPKGA